MKKTLLFLFLFSVCRPSFAYEAGHFYHTGKTKEKLIALTFDDGPGKFTLPILDFLKEHHIRATFFMLGDQIEEYPDIARQVIAAGHEVGNHTYTHFDYHLAKNSAPERLEHELAQTEATLKRAAGIQTHVVRMPYGYFNHTWLLPLLKKHGYALVHWSFGEDWMAYRWQDPKAKTGKIVLTPDVMAEDYIRNAKPGAVFLFHDGGRHRERTLAAVKIVVQTLEAKGYRFIAADDMFPDSGEPVVPSNQPAPPSS